MATSTFNNSAYTNYLSIAFRGTESRSLEAYPSGVTLNSGSFLNPEGPATSPELKQGTDPVLGGVNL